MQDFSDSTLDTLIGRSLRSGASLRPGQKQRAWESLRERVVSESMVMVAEPAPVPRSYATLLRSALRWLVWMCLEESHYERAARRRRLDSYPLALCGEPLGGGIWIGSIRREPV